MQAAARVSEWVRRLERNGGEHTFLTFLLSNHHCPPHPGRTTIMWPSVPPFWLRPPVLIWSQRDRWSIIHQWASCVWKPDQHWQLASNIKQRPEASGARAHTHWQLIIWGLLRGQTYFPSVISNPANKIMINTSQRLCISCFNLSKFYSNLPGNYEFWVPV